MTDKLLTDLPLVAVAADSDLAYIVVDPGGSPDSRQMELADLLRLGEANLSVTDGVGSQVVAPATWTKVNQFDTAESVVSLVANDVDDSIAVPRIGRYAADWSLTFELNSADEAWFAIRWNGAVAGVLMKQQVAAANQPLAVHMRMPVNATVGDAKIEAWVYVVGGSTFSVKESILHAVRIG